MLGRARLAVGLWLGAAFAGALVLAWVVVAPGGWRQGTAAPLLIDGMVVGLCACAWLVHRKLAGSWLRERNVASSIEHQVGMAPGCSGGPWNWPELCRPVCRRVLRIRPPRKLSDALVVSIGTSRDG